MKYRSLKTRAFAPKYLMGDTYVRQPLPSNEMDYLDPFILLHHFDQIIPEDITEFEKGVGPHPHRGFSPVTFMFKGGIHHRDSRGNNQSVGAGGTQWMNAGMGVIHSERPVGSGQMEGIQLWVNTPAAHKMDIPAYQAIQAGDTPKFESGNGITVNIISGELLGIKGPVSSYTEVNAATILGKSDGSLEIEIPPTHQLFVYVLSGKVLFNGKDEMEQYFMAVFNEDGEGISIKCETDSQILLMSGKPIGEKIATHGPFVMNNETEIMQAFKDYQMGKMGILIEE